MSIFIRKLIQLKPVRSNAMSYKVLNAAVEQYRTQEQSLAGAAAAAGVSTTELAAELRSQGVSLRESDEAFATTTRY